MINRAKSAEGEAGRLGKVFTVFLRLGLTSFGGPIAHLGHFREAFVVHRRWLDERSYADLVALCQFLPGPASSQAGIAIGLLRAGYAGAFAAWAGFTLPSAIAMALFAAGLARLGDQADGAWLDGLKAAAVAVLVQALLGMFQTLAPDRARATLAVAAAALVLAVPTVWGQIGAIALGGLAGLALLAGEGLDEPSDLPVRVSPRTGVLSLALFGALLIGLPLLASRTDSLSLDLAGAFYRAGSLVFGGGHVVLPLLQAEVVLRGWVTSDEFLAGYGAAQAVPGPLFTFAAYLGMLIAGWSGFAIAVVAIFAPSFLLVIGAMPFWQLLRHMPSAQSALRGINAAVVGLLLAAFYDPVWISGVTSAKTFLLAVTAFLLLYVWQVSPWLVVVLSALSAGLLAKLPVLFT